MEILTEIARLVIAIRDAKNTHLDIPRKNVLCKENASK
jgi:hypothetical protein